MSFKESFWVGITVTILAAVLFGILYFVNYTIDQTACEQVGKRTKRVTIYEYPSGCYVVVEGEWVLLGQWRMTPKAEDKK